MSFKFGDRVYNTVCAGVSYDSGWNIGSIGTITSVWCGGRAYGVLLDNDKCQLPIWFEAYELADLSEHERWVADVIAGRESA